MEIREAIELLDVHEVYMKSYGDGTKELCEALELAVGALIRLMEEEMDNTKAD